METWFLIFILYFGDGPSLGQVSTIPIQSKTGIGKQLCTNQEAKLRAKVKEIIWSQCVRLEIP